jgi:epoxyqueuosine reductase QueG
MEWTEALKAAARAAGADLVGVAGLEPFRNEGAIPLPDSERFANAVSLAVRLDDDIIDGLGEGPTPAYARHYRAVNAALDGITNRLLRWVVSQGFSGCAIPASQVVDTERLLGSLSHKAVARLAGIGWQGKSLLIVSPQYGPRIRLATLLTDMPLRADQPLKNRCGTCKQCAAACPAMAIKNVRTASRYANRDEALYFSRCVAQTLSFKSRPDINAQICGVCVRVCPFGRKAPKRRAGRETSD